jgi:hypothetical protein
VQRDIERLLVRGENAGIDRLSGSCADILAHRDASQRASRPTRSPTTNDDSPSYQGGKPDE